MPKYDITTNLRLIDFCEGHIAWSNSYPYRVVIQNFRSFRYKVYALIIETIYSSVKVTPWFGKRAFLNHRWNLAAKETLEGLVIFQMFYKALQKFGITDYRVYFCMSILKWLWVHNTVLLIRFIDPLRTSNFKAFQLCIGTLSTPMKRYDLMHSINGRGTFLMTQACLPHLLESKEQGKVPHILNNSPVSST